jgi:hypothetical protein
MLSLHDLRSAPAGLDWHEAVAVAAALGTLLVEGRAPACPEPADVSLLASGDLRVVGGRHVDGSAAGGLARVLGELLESAPHPAELRQLVETYAAEGGRGEVDVDAVGDLVAALAFFERPGRKDVLAIVAARAEPAIERARGAAALEALTSRTRQAPAVPRAAAVAVPTEGEVEAAEAFLDDPDGAGEGGHRRLFVPVAVGLTAFLAVAYGAASWMDRPASPPQRAAMSEEDDRLPPPDAPTVAPRTPTANAPAGRSAQAAPRERPSGAPVSPGPPRVPESGGTTVPAATLGTPAPGAARSRAVDVIVAERDGRVLPSPSEPLSLPHAVASGQIFQAGDLRVTPAILIRPNLPANPPPEVPEEQIGTLEFVLTETGAVERVRLVSPANRYQERMLVAAAKTWQFQPATRDGRPVRYRTRLRLTL